MWDSNQKWRPINSICLISSGLLNISAKLKFSKPPSRCYQPTDWILDLTSCLLMDPARYFWSLAVNKIFAAVKCKSALRNKTVFFKGFIFPLCYFYFYFGSSSKSSKQLRNADWQRPGWESHQMSGDTGYCWRVYFPLVFATWSWGSDTAASVQLRGSRSKAVTDTRQLRVSVTEMLSTCISCWAQWSWKVFRS